MMNTVPKLRLVRDDDGLNPDDIVTPPLKAASMPAPVIPAAMAATLPISHETLELVEDLRRQVDSLNQELLTLRRRGDTLNHHMHRIDEELRLAARLQQEFLPKALPQLGQVHFHTLFRPAGYVSGDFYDVMRLDETHIGFYIADAVGHGVPAALLTMFIKNAIATKQITPGGYRLLSASETMCRLNETLLEQRLSAATFATALYGIINVQTHQMTFARGGHPYPILIRHGEPATTLEAEGGLLGVFADEQFQEYTINLKLGDRVLLYTDGVEVAFGDGDDLTRDRWKQELTNLATLSAADLLAEFGRLIDTATGSLAPKDDLTMVVLEIR